MRPITIVEGWREKTPANFAFSLKVPQSITHEKLLLDCKAEVDGFVGAARLLGDKLACCLLQFGYFNRKAFASLDTFLERLQPFLDLWPSDVPVALEIRNKAWVTAKIPGLFASTARDIRADGSGLDAVAIRNDRPDERRNRTIWIRAIARGQ